MPISLGSEGKVLVPVDFDENSLAVLDVVVDFVGSGNGIIYLVHVVPDDEIHLLRPVYRPEESGGANEEWAQKVASEKLEEISRSRLGSKIRHEVLVRIGHPAETILQLEKELGVDLVVMATHGRTGISHFILGSVAEQVVRESSCPVLTIRKR
jgi:nucleotide-binding universal stress UspA family protein